MEQKNQVGQTLPNGYTVIANYKNRYILAHHSKAGVAEPFAIWNIDQDGNTYSGSYFGKQEDAEKYFTYCCFSWLEANTCTPKCFEEKQSAEPNTSDQDIKKLLYQQMQLLAKESNSLDGDIAEKSIAMLKIARAIHPALAKKTEKHDNVHMDQSLDNDSALSTLKMNREGLVWLNGHQVDRCISVSVSEINSTDLFIATLTVEIDGVDMDYKTFC